MVKSLLTVIPISLIIITFIGGWLIYDYSIKPPTYVAIVSLEQNPDTFIIGYNETTKSYVVAYKFANNRAEVLLINKNSTVIDYSRSRQPVFVQTRRAFADTIIVPYKYKTINISDSLLVDELN